MAQTNILESISENVLSGKLSDAIELLQSKQCKLNEKDVLKTIIRCCTLCNNNKTTPLNVDVKNLQVLLNTLVPLLSEKFLVDVYLEQYYQSMFYILSLVVSQKEYEILLEMENILILPFLTEQIPQKVLQVVPNICAMVYNALINLGDGDNLILKLSYLVAKMYDKFYLDRNIFLKYSLRVATMVNLKKLNLEEEHRFIVFVLSRIEENEYTKEKFGPIIKHLSVTMGRFIRHRNIGLFKQNKLLLNSFKYVNECRTLLKIFEITVLILPEQTDTSKEIQTCYDLLKKYKTEFGVTQNLIDLCIAIGSFCAPLTSFYKHEKNKFTLVDETHCKLAIFLGQLAEILRSIKKKCETCKSGCTVTRGYADAKKLYAGIGAFAKLHISSGKHSPEYCKLVFNLLDGYHKDIGVLKKNNCETWVACWQEIGVFMYNIGVQLYTHKNFKDSLQHMSSFYENFIKLEGLSGKLISEQIGKITVGALVDLYVLENHIEEAFKFISLLTLMSLGKPEDWEQCLLSRWINMKVKFKGHENNFQKTTLCELLDKHYDEITHFLPDVAINSSQKINITACELSYYKFKWNSKIPMLGCLSELNKIASPFTLAQIIIKIWGKFDMSIAHEVLVLIKEIILKLEGFVFGKTAPEEELYLGFLYFLSHKYTIKEQSRKTQDLIEKNHLLKPLDGKHPRDIQDPNDQCDVISAYESLKLSNNVLHDLNRSLRVISKVMTKNFNLDCLKFLESDDFFKLLTDLAEEFRLHCFSSNALKTWNFALRVAEELENDVYILTSASFILEKQLNAKLATKVEKIVQKLQNDPQNNPSAVKAIIIYYNCKAQFNLDNGEVEKAQQNYNNAANLAKSHPKVETDKVLKALINLIKFKLSMLPCKMSVSDHKEVGIVCLFDAFMDIRNHFELDDITSYSVSLLFEIHNEVLNMYHTLRMPREVRGYGKDFLLLSQTLVLPLQTCRILTYLLYADVRCCRLADCQVKIDGLSEILGLSHKRHCENFDDKDMFDSFEECRSKDIDELVNRVQEIMLDAPQAFPQRKQMYSGSPSFEIEAFKAPGFIAHDRKCDCFYCACHEYQQLVLNKFHLDALIHLYEGRQSLAVHFLSETLELHKKLVQKCDSTNATEMFLDNYVNIRRDYINLLDLNDTALSLNDELLSFLKGNAKKTTKYYNLLNECVEQRIFLLMDNKTTTNNTLKPPEASDSLVKTPTSVNKATLPALNKLSPRPAPTKIKRVKAIHFDLSDHEGSPQDEQMKPPLSPRNPLIKAQSMATPAPSSVRKIKIAEQATVKGSRKKPLTLFGSTETPGSKVKIFTDDVATSVTKSRRKKTVLQPLAVVDSEENCTESVTPSVGKVDVKLPSRTRLLTEKLKKSTLKKDEPLLASSSKSKAELGPLVRKNLLTELNSELMEQSVRRSSRRKK